jgi:hypothetical protein
LQVLFYKGYDTNGQNHGIKKMQLELRVQILNRSDLAVDNSNNIYFAGKILLEINVINFYIVPGIAELTNEYYKIELNGTFPWSTYPVYHKMVPITVVV